MKLRLDSIQYASSEISLFRFVALDGSELSSINPGAHIGLHLPNGLVRQYSLINQGESPTSYLIGVKREDNGRGGSLFMHKSLHVGTVLEVDQPRNNFPLLEDQNCSVLIAGGIGITPIYSMVSRLQELGRNFHIYYACRSKSEAIFIDQIADTKNANFHFDDEAGAYFDMRSAIDSAPEGTHFYCCGPQPMLAAYENATKTAKVPSENVHLEYFSAELDNSASSECTVISAKSGKRYHIPAGTSILRVLLASGADVPFSCEQGVCGACETKVIEGIPDHRDMIFSDEEKESNKVMMICCSGSLSDTLILDI
ncbi:oxidoreductase [Pseudomaricurvus alcaniphilus]|uniref:PDR/VanB family oxidoreductase n=1 Tax=Pseudomaricurvus alcaniphilus TaxID=1166482 RepID=UPI00140957CD|nr:PDR/VanB family oxidoreductase [Pseudomaricurvus alcaniphilus]NHN39900.1 oxidoreductase [Pseudomaricurvus alcaniphilus]